MELPKWHERPESSEKKLTQQETLDGKNFMKLADHFITFANNKNKTIKSTDLKYVMLYASARYSAHVAKNVIEIDNHEDFVKHMSAQFIDMLREHLADPNL
ncbi:DUF3144 domain-containing protein [Alphaproteobacteria bacterium]|jgi:Ca2+-binding EF-hand superfamily protein|nr:DUF3144 domain-containing protein [Alphaproteobacteria bacterium]|tara:strand:+ start:113 stop:415 length:303 start_codon:yes stop_codon:yes gene_type:complete